jgi:hypothetical protein
MERVVTIHLLIRTVLGLTWRLRRSESIAWRAACLAGTFSGLRTRFKEAPLGFKFGGEGPFIGKRRAIFGSQHLVGQSLYGVLGDGVIFRRAENDADRRI